MKLLVTHKTLPNVLAKVRQEEGLGFLKTLKLPEIPLKDDDDPSQKLVLIRNEPNKETLLYDVEFVCNGERPPVRFHSIVVMEASDFLKEVITDYIQQVGIPSQETPVTIILPDIKPEILKKALVIYCCGFSYFNEDERDEVLGLLQLFQFKGVEKWLKGKDIEWGKPTMRELMWLKNNWRQCFTVPTSTDGTEDEGGDGDVDVTGTEEMETNDLVEETSSNWQECTDSSRKRVIDQRPDEREELVIPTVLNCKEANDIGKEKVDDGMDYESNGIVASPNDSAPEDKEFRLHSRERSICLLKENLEKHGLNSFLQKNCSQDNDLFNPGSADSSNSDALSNFGKDFSDHEVETHGEETNVFNDTLESVWEDNQIKMEGKEEEEGGSDLEEYEGTSCLYCTKSFGTEHETHQHFMEDCGKSLSHFVTLYKLCILCKGDFSHLNYYLYCQHVETCFFKHGNSEQGSPAEILELESSTNLVAVSTGTGETPDTVSSQNDNPCAEDRPDGISAKDNPDVISDQGNTEVISADALARADLNEFELPFYEVKVVAEKLSKREIKEFELRIRSTDVVKPNLLGYSYIFPKIKKEKKEAPDPFPDDTPEQRKARRKQFLKEMKEMEKLSEKEKEIEQQREQLDMEKEEIEKEKAREIIHKFLHHGSSCTHIGFLDAEDCMKKLGHWKCWICLNQFPNRMRKKKHFRVEHADSQGFVHCPVCTRLVQFTEADDHFQQIHDETRNSCPQTNNLQPFKRVQRRKQLGRPPGSFLKRKKAKIRPSPERSRPASNENAAHVPEINSSSQPLISQQIELESSTHEQRLNEQDVQFPGTSASFYPLRNINNKGILEESSNLAFSEEEGPRIVKVVSLSVPSSNVTEENHPRNLSSLVQPESVQETPDNSDNPETVLSQDDNNWEKDTTDRADAERNDNITIEEGIDKFSPAGTDSCNELPENGFDNGRILSSTLVLGSGRNVDASVDLVHDHNEYPRVRDNQVAQDCDENTSKDLHEPNSKITTSAESENNGTVMLIEEFNVTETSETNEKEESAPLIINPFDSLMNRLLQEESESSCAENLNQIFVPATANLLPADIAPAQHEHVTNTTTNPESEPPAALTASFTPVEMSAAIAEVFSVPTTSTNEDFLLSGNAPPGFSYQSISGNDCQSANYLPKSCEITLHTPLGPQFQSMAPMAALTSRIAAIVNKQDVLSTGPRMRTQLSRPDPGHVSAPTKTGKQHNQAHTSQKNPEPSGSLQHKDAHPIPVIGSSTAPCADVNSNSSLKFYEGMIAQWNFKTQSSNTARGPVLPAGQGGISQSSEDAQQRAPVSSGVPVGRRFTRWDLGTAGPPEPQTLPLQPQPPQNVPSSQDTNTGRQQGFLTTSTAFNITAPHGTAEPQPTPEPFGQGTSLQYEQPILQIQPTVIHGLIKCDVCGQIFEEQENFDSHQMFCYI